MCNAGSGGTAVIINSDSTYTSSETVTLTITAADTLAVQMMIANDSAFSGGSWEDFTSSKQWNIGSGDDTKAVYIKFRNQVGVESVTNDSDIIVLDSANPSGVTLVILEGATTVSPNITLQLVVGEDTSAMQYRVSEFSDYSGADWQDFSDTTDTRSFVLGAGGETKTVYFQVKDAAGNTSQDTAQVNYLDMPYPVIGFTGTALSGDYVRLTWSASPSTDVDSYVIYTDSGTGTVVYATPLAEVDTGMLYYETGPLTPGETWTFGLRVKDLTGSEEQNTTVRATVTTKSETDPNPGIITITHDDQNPDVAEGVNEQGNQNRKEKVYDGAAAEVLSGDTSGAYGVDLPSGGVVGSTSINLTIINDTAAELRNVPRGRGGFDTGGFVMEVTLDNGQTNFDTGAIIRIPFLDRDGDGVIDGTRVRLTLVQILYYSDTDGQWHALPQSAVQIDYADSMIVAWTGHFSEFSPGKEFGPGDLGSAGTGGLNDIPDGDVDADDLDKMNVTYGEVAGSGNYNEAADIVTTGSSEGRVDEEDLFEFASEYGN